MIAFWNRGAPVCAAVFALTAFPSSTRAQVPIPGMNPVVTRAILEHAAASGFAAGAREASTSVTATASVARGAALSRLGSLRPGSTRSFLARQLEFPRVRRAYESKEQRVAGLFRDLEVTRPEVFFRVFKREQVLEVWARDRGEGAFELLGTYPVCKLSGRLGPKRRQGDLQIPEGFYEIDLLNPQSRYHLSMRVDYPNAVDRARGSGERLGGDIYIHGGCATIGCVPVTDRWIEELYLIALHARDAGQETIPVHIFPTRLDTPGLQWLGATYGTDFVDFPFWRNLQEGYLAFEATRTVPVVGYDGARYTFTLPAPTAAPTVAAVPGS